MQTTTAKEASLRAEFEKGVVYKFLNYSNTLIILVSFGHFDTFSLSYESHIKCESHLDCTHWAYHFLTYFFQLPKFVR